MPAAGIGKRMASAIPKQYLKIQGKSILEHTLQRLLSHPYIAKVIVAINPNDHFFSNTSLVNHAKVKVVIGGDERVDSVFAALNALNHSTDDPLDPHWVLVHDAARPCVLAQDITDLIHYCQEKNHGAVLGSPVSDTMKQVNTDNIIEKTQDRNGLWRALTPQMYKVIELKSALKQGLQQGITITDEASAMEASGFTSGIVQGRSDNIKITQPEDLPLAEFILTQQQSRQTSDK